MTLDDAYDDLEDAAQELVLAVRALGKTYTADNLGEVRRVIFTVEDALLTFQETLP